MDDEPLGDVDSDYRAFACDLAQWLFEGSSVHPADVGEFIAAAACIAHFISNGEGVSFECNEGSRKFVRGGI